METPHSFFLCGGKNKKSVPKTLLYSHTGHTYTVSGDGVHLTRDWHLSCDSISFSASCRHADVCRSWDSHVLWVLRLVARCSRQINCKLQDGFTVSHRIHVWCIYQHVVDFYGQCIYVNKVYIYYTNTWILWVFQHLSANGSVFCFLFSERGSCILLTQPMTKLSLLGDFGYWSKMSKSPKES